jgi:AcrR family transcriptional regulator
MEVLMSQKLPKDIRVEALLNAAVEEFLQKGFDGASMDAIARRAGVSKGGLYHHFPNKEALLMEANRKLSEPVEKMAETALASVSAVEGLRNYIREYLTYWIARPREMSFLFLSMYKAFESEQLMAYYKEYVDAATCFFVSMFERAALSGELAVPDASACGITLMGALDGVITYAIMYPDSDIDALAARLETIWLGPERGRLT